jgi:hypothetical protein
LAVEVENDAACGLRSGDLSVIHLEELPAYEAAEKFLPGIGNDDTTSSLKPTLALFHDVVMAVYLQSIRLLV